MTTITKETFAAVVANQEALNASMIKMQGIENASANMIATKIIHASEKKGAIVQVLKQDVRGEDLPYYNYARGENFEYNSREIAIIAVQLSQILPYLDRFYPMEEVISNTAIWKKFRNVAYANRFMVEGMYVAEEDKKENWMERIRIALHLAADANLVEIDEEGNIQHTRTYLGSCISRKGISHQTQPITNENRRKERVKGRMTTNARKEGLGKHAADALAAIESHGQRVNTWLLDAINGACEIINGRGINLPDVLQTSMHVIDGCNDLRAADTLNSEYFLDLRGRLYQFAHRGPNPQSSDLAKALCYHTADGGVEFLADSEEADIFLNEFYGEIIGSRDNEWAMEDRIRVVAARPTDCLIRAFEINNGKLPFKKFFSYMDMCRTWVDLHDNGVAKTWLGFGPDAKCSGAQIFAILAGCKDMAESCGLITGFAKKPADPYMRSSTCAANISKRHKNPRMRTTVEISRNDIKRPFMAVQYGGGVPALMKGDFLETVSKLGIAPEDRSTFISDVIIDGIVESMGPTISSFIESLRNAVENYCNEHDVDSFSYKHIDGFTVTKKGEASVKISEERFIVNFGAENRGVIFGTEDGWFVPSITSGKLQRQNFIYYFPVHFVQGLDATMARYIATFSQKEGIRGYSTIHDQFRACIQDAALLRSKIIPEVYEHMFINNDPVKHLAKQINQPIYAGNPLSGKTQVVTKEILFSKDAYYFE